MGGGEARGDMGRVRTGRVGAGGALPRLQCSAKTNRGEHLLEILHSELYPGSRAVPKPTGADIY